MECLCAGDKREPPPIGSTSPSLSAFLLYAERFLRLGDCCRTRGGSLGVHAVARSGDGDQLRIGHSTVLDPEHNLYAPSTSLGRGVTLGAIQTDVIDDDGVRLRSPLPFPAATMPPQLLAPGAGPAGADVGVAAGEIKALLPGDYGVLTVTGTLLLNPGVYSFTSATFTDGARVVAIADTVQIRIRDFIAAGRRVRLIPAFRRCAGTLAIFVAGDDDGSRPAVSFGEGCRVRALLAVPHGTLAIADHAHLTGAFAAFDIIAGNEVCAEFQDGFPQDAPGQHGSQQLQGYYGPHPDRSVAPLVGPVPAGTVVPLTIGLPVRDPAGLQTFIRQVADPKSASFRKYLTQPEFATNYGATDADYQALKDWATAAGLTIYATFPNRLLLCVSGTAAQVGQALHVNLAYRLQSDGIGTFVAVDREPSLDLAVPILEINGVKEFRVPQHAGGTGGGGSYRAADLRQAYLGTDPNLQKLDGTGQVVGLLELNSYNPADISGYDALQVPPLNPANVQLYSIAAPPIFSGYSPNAETVLDIEMVQAMAPNATVLVFQTALGVTLHGDAVFHAMANANPPLTSASCSYNFGRSDNSQQALDQMAANGVSFFTASGDFGDVGDPQSNLDLLSQTLVGGTILNTAAPGTVPYYLSENTWNQASAPQQKAVTGGGIMDGNNYNQQCYCWPWPLCCGSGVDIPSWQIGIMQTSAAGNGGSTRWRNFPDVAMAATNLEIVYNGQTQGSGGTSAAAPLWAGYIALVNQRIKSIDPAAGLVGFANTTFYDIGLTRGLADDLYKLCFNDIADNVGNFNGFGPGYNAVAGYDLCTGLGSPQPALIYQLSSPTPLAKNQPLDLIRIVIGTGGDNLRGNGGFGSGCSGTGCTADIFFPGYDEATGVGVKTVTIKPTGTSQEFANNTTSPPFDFALDKDNAGNPLPAVTPSQGIVGIRLNIQQDYEFPCTADNWNITTLSVDLFNPPYSAATAVCQLRLVGTQELQSGGTGLIRLSESAGSSGSGPSTPIYLTGPGSGCP